jgi:hypothetical protein
VTHTPSELAWQDAERTAARWVRLAHPDTWRAFLIVARVDRGLPPDATIGRPPKPSERQPI